MAHDREVAGIRCSAVLDALSDYVDGEVPEAERARIEAHLRGCDWCERFGGAYSSLVGTLRGELSGEPGPDDGARRRLRERLGLS